MNRNPFKSAVFAAIVALLAFAPAAWAQEVQVSTEDGLRNAIANSQAGTTIILDANISITQGELVFDKGMILDLHGRTITAFYHIRVTGGWTLQIYDNSESGRGVILGRYLGGDGCAIYIDNGSTLEIFSGIIILMSAWMTYQGSMDFTYGMMFLVSGFIVYGQMELLANGAFMMEQIETAVDQMNETYNVPKLTGTESVDENKTDIEIKDVTFGYDSRVVLDKVSAKIPAKSKCAIVGYSGSGKTTLCNLIVRFWDIQSGSITFGGKDIKNYAPDELLSHFSMVFQNVFLFNDTIENNIKFGCPNASHEQIVEVAKRARCHEFIEALPDGYNTVIGENGNSLSGGEKQRISIARALLKDAPVVILDEATSSVDPENESELMAAIAELTKGKTVISIAHRLNTVKNADQILVLDHGHIVQRGTHKELCNVDGVYKRFLNIREASAGWSIS